MQPSTATPQASNVDLYLLKLSFIPKVLGAGSMTLALTVNAVSGTLHGQARGKLQEGTKNPSTFTADASGVLHSTGFGPNVKVGSVRGQAFVSFPPPAIGSYLAPFSASFSLDADGKGTGQFSVGHNTYADCVVSIETR
jgi:hypothetical protein